MVINSANTDSSLPPVTSSTEEDSSASSSSSARMRLEDGPCVLRKRNELKAGILVPPLPLTAPPSPSSSQSFVDDEKEDDKDDNDSRDSSTRQDTCFGENNQQQHKNLFENHSPLKLYDRQSEEQELHEAFERCCVNCISKAGRRIGSVDKGREQLTAQRNLDLDSITSERGELVLVTGASGTGKSFLVETVLKPRVIERGGFYISGKFDQLERPEEYYPVVRAITEYVRLVSNDVNALESIRETIRNGCSDIGNHLIDLIPEVRALFPEKNEKMPDADNNEIFFTRQRTESNSSTSIDECMLVSMQQTTIASAFRRFFSCVCTCSRPMVLVLDDLQWCDPASLELLSNLVRDRIPGLMVVGSCRGNEISMQHSLSVTLRELEARQVEITQIETRNLDFSALESLVADVLSQPAYKGRKLCDLLWKHTNGNIFFVVQLLKSLAEEGLLYHSEDDAWTCDSDFASTLHCDDALHLISGKINRLDSAVQQVLIIAACLGCEFDEHLLSLIVGYDVVPSLHIAEEKGLVVALRWRTWRFVHDQIQQSAYSFIPLDDREGIHLQIARSLLYSDQLSTNAFLVANQLRLGVRLVENEEERVQMALMLLRVGEKASQTSAFGAAADYLNLGIRLVNKRGARHWRDQYDLSLSLYSAAAEVEYCIGNFAQMDCLIEEIIKHSRCLEDKSRALMLSMYSLGSRNELQLAIDRGLDVLKEFDEVFPSKPSVFTILWELRKTKKMLRKLSDNDILSLPKMGDESKLSAMRIMNLLFAYCLNGRPMYAPLIAARLVQTTLIHGMSRMASVAFSAYGMLLCMAFNEVELGIRYGKVSLSILEKFKAKEWLARTYSAVYGFCLTAVEPLRDQLKPLLISHRVGLGNDIEFSMLSAAMYSGIGIHSSAPLPQLLEDVTAFLGLMKAHRQVNMIQFLRPNMQFIMNMMGQCEDPRFLDGDAMNAEEAMMEAICTKNATIKAIIHLLKLMLLSFFQLHRSAELEAIELSKGNLDSFSRFANAVYWLHEGLVSVSLSETKRHRRLTVARRNLKRLKGLASYSTCNYLNKVYLLDAAIEGVSGRFHQSFLKYDEAIEQGKKEKLWSEVGLAAEYAASALVRRGRRGKAQEYLRIAISAYEEWGAHAKIVDIQRQLDEIALCPNDDSSQWVFVPVGL